ncbi:MAG: hypothetical protein EA426_07640 [Spirochaetaceae bacterium]|nr:MAG: hypothetical protein EA426_07640 [Spirochaetaceae bacterium]
MLDAMIDAAKRGENVFISDVRTRFAEISETEARSIFIELLLLDGVGRVEYTLSVPRLTGPEGEAVQFVASYVRAEVYNILSSMGGRTMTIYTDTSDAVVVGILRGLHDDFCVGLPRSQRTGYGNCVNVIDRMLAAIDANSEPFTFVLRDIAERPADRSTERAEKAKTRESSGMLTRVTADLDGKAICGIDIGGTDIKMALAIDGTIVCFKEYDWNPTSYAAADMIVDPILILTRLVRAYASFAADGGDRVPHELREAMGKDAGIENIKSAVEAAEKRLGDRLLALDAVGVSFPDVIIRDKVVGGETTKTRAIKRNPALEFESEFAKITSLDEKLRALCRSGGAVKIMNDGPMSAYTAAVETAAVEPERVADGVLAYSLGTELGTGWVDGDGNVPEMPLECYNFIIDLGDFVARGYPAEDVRSNVNVNTGLAGTLQRYTSQSGVFRLAIDRFKAKRPDLYREIFDSGFVVTTRLDGREILAVPTEPRDMRKAFLEHVMALPEREKDEIVNDIFRRIGVYLAITWLETVHTVRPDCREITLFGRVVKNPRCFELIREGALSVESDIRLHVADAGMANTPLMKQLDADPDFTVAQFAQAVGAIYFGNQGLIG